MASSNKETEQQYDWSAHYDDEGRLYYYNSKTGESSWETPAEGFNPPEEDPTAITAISSNAKQYDWTAHYDDEGRMYYFNEKTEESAWEAPAEGFNPPEEETSSEAVENPVDHAETTKGERKEAEADEVKDSTENDDAPIDAAANSAAEKVVAAAKEPPVVADDTTVEGDVDAPKQHYDWSAHYDDEGRLYYFNEKTEESAWEAPAEGFNPPPEDDANSDEKEQAENQESAIKESAIDNKEVDEDAAHTKKYDWSAHYDDEGRLYYYNEKTEESAWEAPAEGFNPPEAADGYQKIPDNAVDSTTAAWVAYHDEDGREYYYNQETGETSWDKPKNYVAAADLSDADSTTKSPPTAMEVDEETKTQEVDVEMKDLEQDIEEKSLEKEEETIDPAVKRLQDAEAALNKTDSVLEPSCMSNVITVVASTDGNPAKAIAALIKNYYGQTAVCGLLARWMTDLNASKRGTKSNTAQKDAGEVVPNLNDDSDATADKIRDLAQDVINKMAKERFQKEVGDKILDLSKAEATFLDEMMDSPRWRKLLIDLVATHKDSAVLIYSLEAISKRGHHREIAKRIDISEYFSVFNAMVLAELAVIGCQAVSAGANVAEATFLNELVVDVCQSCTKTSYTYLYSIELLRRLKIMARAEVKAAVESSKDNADDGQERFRRAIRKWEALSENLENSMLDPSVSLSAVGILRKRRLDVAFTINDLYQGQRRRRRLIESNGDGSGETEEHGNAGENEGLEAALLNLLRKHSVGTQMNDAVLDPLLPSGLDMDTRGVGDLLIHHTLAIRALLGHLFKPGPTRVMSPSVKSKCARLVALASIAAEESAKKEDPYLQRKKQNESSEEEQAYDEIALTRMIVQGSQLCEQLETVISFLTTSGSDKPGQVSANPGQKLCSLALKCAPVGLGVMMWARELTHGPEFATSASFATLSVSILSLVRLVAVQHPFARTDALQIALAFLRHSNPDISYQKVNAIKECSLRLLLFLLIEGDVVPVFGSITARLNQPGSSDLDASLVRYFVAGVLEVVQPPVSPVFVRMFGGLLKAPKAVDAIRSTYFAETNRKRLTDLLMSFKDVRLYNGSQLSHGDASLVSSLLSIYQIK